MIPDLPPVEAALIEWAAEVCGATRVEVHFTGLSEMGDGPFFWSGDPCRSRPDLRLRSGERTLTVRPQLTVWVEVPLATRDFAVGERVEAALGEVPIDAVRGAVVHEAWVATTAIAAGTPITQAVTRPEPDVLRDAAVELVVIRGDLVVSAPGRVLQEGRVGDRVRVINEATGVVLTGEVTTPGQITIR